MGGRRWLRLRDSSLREVAAEGRSRFPKEIRWPWVDGAADRDSTVEPEEEEKAGE